MADAMELEDETTQATNQGNEKKRFEVKKWSAVALWAWGNFS